MERLKVFFTESAVAPWLCFIAISLAIMLPLLGPGYILTLDLVFTPHLPWPTDITNTFLLEALLWLLNQVIPGDVLEKIILWAILLLSGMGAYRLMTQLTPKAATATFWQWGAYFAGIFYMINPFIYARFMAGQWLVLLGYALLPFFVHALLQLLKNPSWATMWRLAAWMFAIISVSIHHVGILAILLIITVCTITWQYRHQLGKIRNTMIALGGAVGVVLLASSYWLVPALLGRSSITSAANNFDAAHFEGFATLGHGAFGAIGQVLRLQGFWAEAQQLFILPNALIPAWGIIALLLWILIGMGMKYLWKLQWRTAVIIGASSLIAIILAATPLIAFFSQHIPFIGGYREPHKFINILALAFALFGGSGVAILLHKLRNHARFTQYLARISVILLPFVLTPTMLWGFYGQLTPRQYPTDWHTVNNYLNTKIKDGKILFLPWYQYLWADFAERTIANPADKFFEKPIIVSDNLAFKDIPPTVPDQEKRQITKALEKPATIVDTFKELDIRYILIYRQDTDETYDFITQSANFTLLSETETLLMYRLEGER